MTFDPTSILTDAEKFAIVDDRAKTWAREFYSHQLNREAIEALPDNEGKAGQLEQVDAQLEALSKWVQGAVETRDKLSGTS